MSLVTGYLAHTNESPSQPIKGTSERGKVRFHNIRETKLNPSTDLSVGVQLQVPPPTGRTYARRRKDSKN